MTTRTCTHAANRGFVDGSTNTVAVFETDSQGALRLGQLVAPGGGFPRGMAIVPVRGAGAEKAISHSNHSHTPNSNPTPNLTAPALATVLVAGQSSGNVAVFTGDAALAYAGINITALPTPVTIAIFELPRP